MAESCTPKCAYTLSATSRLLEPCYKARGEAAEEADNEPCGKQTEILIKETSQTTTQSETTVSDSALQLHLICHQPEKDFSDLAFVEIKVTNQF